MQTFPFKGSRHSFGAKVEGSLLLSIHKYGLALYEMNKPPGPMPAAPLFSQGYGPHGWIHVTTHQEVKPPKCQWVKHRLCLVLSILTPSSST